ncbi:MAG: hypothetical protein PF569_10070 [Candidatus Woesearchaeota archaeon]|jgi:exosortase/archaeosortase family protein|nr:hypothetical protein [Candidatus Woesearchaeota archaeon]
MEFVKSIAIRYILIIVFINLFLFDFFSDFLGFIFTYISYFFLNLFFEISLVSGNILWQNHLFLIVDECIGVSAYILLTFLFFSMHIKKEVLLKGWGFSILAYSIANLIRIVFLMAAFILFGENFFESIHLIFYEALTGIIVGLIFVYFYREYKIKEKPLVSDVKMILKKYFS